eukprot:GGOE01036966.1.p1 GENE.GGOE01036966.1~~GGOE01036966.1.p1  ORF type:complete len:1224 (-),score=385.99 GGOE01036966.1:114-3533(-)
MGEQKDLLFLVFERYSFCVLEYDAAGEVRTRANGDLVDKIGRKVEGPSIGLINEGSTLVALHLYEGLLKVIPIANTAGHCQLKEAFNLRVEEHNLIDMCFLQSRNPTASSSSSSSSSDPWPTNTVAILYEDTKGNRHVKAYSIVVADKDLVDHPFVQHNVENTASLLIPVPPPLGGLLIVGEELLTYHSGTYTKSSPICSRAGVGCSTSAIRAWCRIDNQRFLLGDQTGRLFVVMLAAIDDSVELHLDCIGETCIPSCLSFLGSSMVFIGGAFTDSQLVRLTSQQGGGTTIDTLESYTNLGPIVDFVVVDLDRQGQGQVVTCSGAYKDGSIRIIRNGIGINELASLQLTGVKGMWSLLEPSLEEMTEGEAPLNAKYMVLSFINETKVLSMEDEESIEEARLAGLASDLPTLLCTNIGSVENRSLGNFFVQVTPKGVRLISCQTKGLVHDWNSPSGCTINMASCNALGGQLLLAGTNGALFYLEVKGHALVLEKQIRLPHEIACIDIHPLDQEARANYCALGLWVDVSLNILSLPNLDLVCKLPLASDVLPRSVLCCNFDGLNYLMCGLGDGNLLVYSILQEDMTMKLHVEKRLTIGSQPITLSLFTSGTSAPGGRAGPSPHQQHVFVTSDRPTVIYSSNRKLLFSNVNLKEVQFVCPFNSQHLQHDSCLALICEENLVLGTIDAIQKLHIRTVPLGEQPKKIAFHQSSQAFALLSCRSPGYNIPQGTVLSQQAGSHTDPLSSNAMLDSMFIEEEVHFLRLLNNHTFECLNTYQLDANENGISLITTTFDGDDVEYIVVGTAYVLQEEHEPSRGRLLVFEVKDNRLLLVAEKDIKGACYCLCAFNGKLLSSCNANVQLWKWQPGTDQDGNKALEYECHFRGSIVTLTLKSRGDFVIVGDLMRSISVLMYKADVSALEEIAFDFNPNMITASEVLGDDVYIGADNFYNLFTLAQNTDTTNDDEHRMLNTLGQFHLGEFVNCFHKGSLVMRMSDQEKDSPPASSLYALKLSPHSLVYGTISGAVGMINPISEQLYNVLLAIQTAIAKVIQGVGGLQFNVWRSFNNERKTVAWKNFLDGDLIESFLDLPRHKMEEVMAHLKVDMMDVSDAALAPHSSAAQAAAAMPTTVEDLIRKIEDLTMWH